MVNKPRNYIYHRLGVGLFGLLRISAGIAEVDVIFTVKECVVERRNQNIISELLVMKGSYRSA